MPWDSDDPDSASEGSRLSTPDSSDRSDSSDAPATPAASTGRTVSNPEDIIIKIFVDIDAGSPTQDPLVASDLVRIFVGSEKVELKARQPLLEDNVPFFAKCLNGDFAEAQTNTIYLPEDEPVLISGLLYWTMTGKLFPPSLKLVIPFHPDSCHLEKSRLFSKTGGKALLYLTELWIVADKYCCARLQNQIIRYVAVSFLAERYGTDAHDAKRLPCRVCQEVVEVLYASTCPTSRLRRLLLQCWAYSLSKSDIEAHRFQNRPRHIGRVPKDENHWYSYVSSVMDSYMRTAEGNDGALKEMLYEWVEEIGDALRLRGQKLELMAWHTDYPDFVNVYEFVLLPIMPNLRAMVPCLEAYIPARVASQSKRINDLNAVIHTEGAQVWDLIEENMWPTTAIIRQELWKYIGYWFRDKASFPENPTREVFSSMKAFAPEYIRRFGGERDRHSPDPPPRPQARQADARQWLDLERCLDVSKYWIQPLRSSVVHRLVYEEMPHDPNMPTAEAAGRIYPRSKEAIDYQESMSDSEW